MDEDDIKLYRYVILIMGLITMPMAFYYSTGWGIAWVVAICLIVFVIYIDTFDVR